MIVEKNVSKPIARTKPTRKEIGIALLELKADECLFFEGESTRGSFYSNLKTVLKEMNIETICRTQDGGLRIWKK